jgi:hypothetical protein
LQRRKEKKRGEERGGVADTTKYVDYLPSFSEVSPKVRVGFARVLSPDFTNRNIGKYTLDDLTTPEI